MGTSPRRLVALTLALVLLPVAPALAKQGAASPHLECSGDPSHVRRIDLTIEGEPTWGLYAVPNGRPRGLVVVFHGYGHTPESWRTHLADIARTDGVVAVAMNYRGSIEGPPVRGWRVREGAEDSIDVAQLFERRCRGFDTIVAYGVSMGGNASGLALAMDARRASGAPLFDWWFDIEGATNVLETYWEARSLEPSGNAYAKRAKEDIEAEMGGPFEARPDVYADHTVVLRAGDVAGSGVKGVVIVHGIGDGLVPYDQSREMASALRGHGTAVQFFTVGTRTESSEPGTTLDGYLYGPLGDVFGALGQEPRSPFAGHASEASTTHDVVTLGFDRLHALFRGELPRCDQEHVVDGSTGAFAPAPDAC